MGQYAVLLVVILVVNVSEAGKLPSNFSTCKRDDKNFTECLKKAIEDAFFKLKDGIKDLEVFPLEPYHIPSITTGEGRGGVVLSYTDYKLHGLTTTKIKSFETKLTDNSLDIKLETVTPNIIMEADYSVKGSALSIVVNGKGNCTITLDNVATKLSIYAESFEKKGIKYLKIKDFIMKISPGKVTYDFRNLFNGNEQLTREVNKVMNENWKSVYDDVAQDFDIALQIVFQDYANKIFTQVPYDQIF